MSKEQKRINIVIDKDLWIEVGIESAKLDITKKEFTTQALIEKIERIRQAETEQQEEKTVLEQEKTTLE